MKLFFFYSLGLRGSTTTSSRPMGFAVGGAKDVNNFRENIHNNYLPIITDLSYEGIFYDYFFDISNEQQQQVQEEKADEQKQLFCPSYSMAFTTNQEYFMTVELNSNLTEETFQRNPMNLIVCIDRSGSMGSSFSSYHYDKQQKDSNDTRSKMAITLDVVSKVIDHLKPNDRLGIIVFDSDASIVQTITQFDSIQLDKLKKELSRISASGGTDMSAAINCCASLFDTEIITNDHQQQYDNRILFLTDAQPNQGNLSENHFYNRIEQLAKHRIYFTFIGVGIDLNTALISSITKHRGANYFSVHNSKKFNDLLDKDFDLIVTPLVFNVELKFQSDLFDVENVYGSPNTDKNQLIRINTLFPSRTDDNSRTRGGVVLIKLKPKQVIQEKKLHTNACLSVTYEDRCGKSFEEKQLIYIIVQNEIYYGNLGIRKAILLVNYINLLKQWIQYERETNQANLSEWERQSTKLTVSKQYRQQFQLFLTHLQTEIDVLNDQDLQQEVKLLNKLIAYDD